ncbi:MAG: cell division protein CrgA [Actinomycetes bacterium]|jgi:uncharacterized membrane protein HdeD (DUF308 family)|nr:MAG: septation inhibitor protein [Actinomycetota bacterium]
MPESKRRKRKSRPLSPQAQQAATKTKEPSPTWYVALMAGLMILGVILVLVRFIFQLDQFVMFIGLLAIAIGFAMTTNYR